MHIGKYIRMSIPSLSWTTAATRPASKPVKVVEPRPGRGFADHYAKVQAEPYFGTTFIFFHGHASCPYTCIDPGLGLLAQTPYENTNHVGRLEKTCLVQKHGQTRALENANKHVYYISPKEYDKV